MIKPDEAEAKVLFAVAVAILFALLVAVVYGGLACATIWVVNTLFSAGLLYNLKTIGAIAVGLWVASLIFRR